MMDSERTIAFVPEEQRGKTATLIILDMRNRPVVVPLQGNMTLGRDYDKSNCDIRVQSRITGRRHGEFVYSDVYQDYYYIDNNSVNGTYINGNKLTSQDGRTSAPYKLQEGDVLRIDHSRLDDPHPEAVLMIFTWSYTLGSRWTVRSIKGLAEIRIGRDEKNTIVLDDLLISRTHAVIRKENGQCWIEDIHSQNGVRVNGREIEKSQLLYEHDVVRIGNTILILWADTIIYNIFTKEEGQLSVNIRKMAVNFGRKTLIKDIEFEAENTDFVLILGGSGAGKTTLINTILGEKKADGEILLDGQNLYRNFKYMKTKIGLVPQFLNLRLNDKVRETLMDVAEIKLPKQDYSHQDKLRRVQDTMEKVGVQNLSEHLISQLSGGQKKKVSVAAQLIGFQKVFICDEPDSGLDAASRMQQMEILKEIADNGKIVMVISHEPDDAVNSVTGESLFTKVLVIAKSTKEQCGQMAFYGTVPEALEFFQVKRLQDIMLEINPTYEGGKGRADYYIQKYTLQPKKRGRNKR
ncbi:hypothetical protein EUBC25_05750 [Claveliimonas bilis]|uniref:FHA domain-containing protein n=1 Tax=Claveliimonas bilis TaxID=3028070 RepID=UPI001E459493|nr:FHA domain-containing protein [Claveliimonas bilis]BCZ26488.1 hypothetical protein EUBC25_05750 [Claveliimonas bilis]